MTRKQTVVFCVLLYVLVIEGGFVKDALENPALQKQAAYYSCVVKTYGTVPIYKPSKYPLCTTTLK